MTTATGTKKENLSGDERSDRRRGMKLVSFNKSAKPFRIAMSQELVDSFQDSDNASLRRKLSADATDAESSNMGETSARSLPIAITLTAVALTGVLIGYMLNRGRDRN